MEITFEVPDALADRLRASWKNLPRHALEALAADGYRHGLLTSAEVQEILGIPSRYDLDGFLKQAGAYLDYTAEDLEEDVRSFLQKTGR